MNIRSLAIAPCFALMLVGLAACGGGKSDNNAATDAASPAGATAAPANAMQNGSGGSMAAGNNGSMAMGAHGAIHNCGAVVAVWVNLNTKVIHGPRDPYYGKTKHGEYLCPAQAKAQGFHWAHGKKNDSMNASNGSSDDSQ
jgi:hypothetical protein